MNEIDIKLPTLFAVELLRGERPHHVAEAVIRAGKKCGKLFRRLEVLDMISLGMRSFIRFRSDLTSPVVLEQVLTEGRGVVRNHGTLGFEVRFPSRQGKVPGFMMYEATRPGIQRMYRGPKIKGWEKAFETKNVLSKPSIRSHVENRRSSVRTEAQS
jgi:hypothetical protein